MLPADNNFILQWFYLFLSHRDTELILVSGHDVPVEVTGVSECLITLRTLVRLLT